MEEYITWEYVITSLNILISKANHLRGASAITKRAVSITEHHARILTYAEDT